MTPKELENLRRCALAAADGAPNWSRLLLKAESELRESHRIIAHLLQYCEGAPDDVTREAEIHIGVDRPTEPE